MTESFSGFTGGWFRSTSPEQIADERSRDEAAEDRILDILGREKLRRPLTVKEVHTSVGHYLVKKDLLRNRRDDSAARAALISLMDPEGDNKVRLVNWGSVELKKTSPGR